MANLFEFEGETYEWEETEDGELWILTSGKEAAKSIMKELAENGELEHADYLARDVIEMAENMDGLRWVVFTHGSDCRCGVNLKRHWLNWAAEHRGEYVHNTGSELMIITAAQAKKIDYENCDTVEDFAEQKINEDAWPFDYKYADLM